MPPRTTAKKGKVTATSERRCKGLIYGPPKHGKTHFLGTAAHDERTAPVAAIDLEGGMPDVLETMPGWGTDFIHMPITSWDDFNAAYERVRSNDEGFKSVAFDSLSETHIFALMNILEEVSGTRSDPDALQQQDWGKALIQLRRLVRYFRDLPLHVFYTAHHKDEVDKREGTITTVNLAGKAAIEIPGLMSLVGYLALASDDDGSVTGEEGKVYRSLLLNNYARIRIGVRAPWGLTPPDEIDDPTVKKVLDVLQYK